MALFIPNIRLVSLVLLGTYGLVQHPPGKLLDLLFFCSVDINPFRYANMESRTLKVSLDDASFGNRDGVHHSL